VVVAYLVFWEPPASVVCSLFHGLRVNVRDVKKLRVSPAFGSNLTVGPRHSSSG
jgi:hypothetical protein